MTLALSRLGCWSEAEGEAVTRPGTIVATQQRPPSMATTECQAHPSTSHQRGEHTAVIQPQPFTENIISHVGHTTPVTMMAMISDTQ